MNISSSGSTYVSKSSSNKGMSGLASGMDTEGMVEAMLANTQAKIDKQNALKTQTTWKQEIYRDLITQINSFQSKFFKSSSPTNLMNQAFFNAMSAMSKSSALKATATSSAAAGSTRVQVGQLATNTTKTSTQAVSGKLEGSIDTGKIDDLIKQEMTGDYKLSLSIGEKDVVVDLKDVFVAGTDPNLAFTITSNQQKADAIVAKINAEFATQGVDATAKFDAGTLSFSSSDVSNPIMVDGDSGAQALARLGLTAGASSQANPGKTSTQLSSKVDFVPSYTIKVTLDDQEKDIKLDMRSIIDPVTGKTDANLFRAELSKQLNSSFGAGQITVDPVGSNGFELKVSTGRKVMIGGDKAVLDALGVKNGQSNRIGLGGKLGDLFFNEKLQGSTYRFTINGEEFSFTKDDTIGDIINAVNTSDAGVRIIYKAQDDKFVIQTNDSGTGREISMSQSEGNLLTSMFGVQSGSTVGSKQLGTPSITAGDEYMSDIKSGVFQINVNGGLYSLEVPPKSGDGNYNRTDLITALNKELDARFGVGNIKLVEDPANGTRIEVADGSIVTIDKVTPAKGDSYAQAAKNGNLAIALGFGENGASNLATGDTTLGELGLDSLGAAGTKLSDLNSINPALTFQDGRIMLSGSGAAVSVGDAATMERLFGQATVSLGQAASTGQDVESKAGQNAIVSIDGLLTERSSNNFTVNGLNIDLTATTGSFVKGTFDTASGKYLDEEGNEVADAVGIRDGYLIDAKGNTLFKGETATIEVTRNTDSIVEGIKGFVDEYNKLVKTMNELLDEDTNYKKYPPLTDAQKKEMSEKEITLWEEKSKEGLMRNDSILSGFVQGMRTAIYEKPAGSSLAIYNLGIDTGDWESKGQLVFTADGEAQLRRMIESDASAVLKLFTDPDEGLGVKLNNIIDATAKTSSGTPGSMVQMAGVKGLASATQNTLYSQLKSIDNRIATLKNTYDKEKARYWKQFNAMEKAISDMNSQSSWLAQQFA